MAHVIVKRTVHYAVIYECRDPVTGRERRRWHRCENRSTPNGSPASSPNNTPAATESAPPRRRCRRTLRPLATKAQVADLGHHIVAGAGLEALRD